MNNNTQSIVKYVHSEFPLDLPIQTGERSFKTQPLTAGDLLRIVKKRKLAILGFAASVFALVAVYTYTRKPMYEAVARLQIDPSRSTNLGLEDGDKPGQPTDIDNYLKTEVMIIQSETVATRVMNALRLDAKPGFGLQAAGTGTNDVSQLAPSERQRLLSIFKENLKVSVAPNTEIVEVRFRSADAALAANTANAVVEEYIKRNFLTRVDGTAQVSLWLSKQLGDIKDSTAESQQKLAEFERENDFLGVDESNNIVTNRLKQLNDELTAAEADRIVKEGKSKLAEVGNPELIDSTSSDTTLQALQKQHAELQAQYSELSAKFGDGYPKLHELQQELAALNAAIKTEDTNVKTRLANQFQAAAQTETMIRKEFVKQKEQANKLNEHVAQFAILKHEVEAGQKLYDTLQLKLKTTGISSGLASSFIDLIDRAEVPDRPVEPRKSLNLTLGLGGGLVGGVLLGLILDSFDDTIRTSDELEAVAALPELACVPFISALDEAKKRKLTSSLKPIHLRSAFTPIMLQDPTSPSVESYRVLCSFLLLSHNPTKVLLVTSATAQEGKSTVSCNLATALAQRGRKVLLVDADLRCSSFHLSQLTSAGLSDICSSGSSSYPEIQPVPGLPSLHVIPAGSRPIDPAAVLQSNRMRELIAKWRMEYEHIIFDTPPALPFADALVLSAHADGVVLVARSDMTRSKALLRARDVLLRSGVRILGVVLNAARQREYYYEYPAGYQQAAVNGKA